MKFQCHEKMCDVYGKLCFVWKIPFPAVTICPEIKAKYNILNITNSYESLRKVKPISDDDLIKMDALTQLCKFSFNQSSKIELNEIPQILQQISPKLNETINNCKRNQISFNCVKHIKHIMTEDGSCFNFNMLNSSVIFKVNS